MKVTFNCYRNVIRDDNANPIGVADFPITEAGGNQKLIAAGTVATAFPDETRYVRVSTDSAIHIKIDGAGVTDTDPQMFANSVEYFGVREGMTPSIIVA